MPSLVATTSALARKTYVRPHFVRTNLLEKLRICDHTAVASAILYKIFRNCENALPERCLTISY